MILFYRIPITYLYTVPYWYWYTLVFGCLYDILSSVLRWYWYLVLVRTPVSPYWYLVLVSRCPAAAAARLVRYEYESAVRTISTYAYVS